MAFAFNPDFVGLLAFVSGSDVSQLVQNHVGGVDILVRLFPAFVFRPDSRFQGVDSYRTLPGEITEYIFRAEHGINSSCIRRMVLLDFVRHCMDECIVWLWRAVIVSFIEADG